MTSQLGGAMVGISVNLVRGLMYVRLAASQLRMCQLETSCGKTSCDLASTSGSDT